MSNGNPHSVTHHCRGHTISIQQNTAIAQVFKMEDGLKIDARVELQED